MEQSGQAAVFGYGGPVGRVRLDRWPSAELREAMASLGCNSAGRIPITYVRPDFKAQEDCGVRAFMSTKKAADTTALVYRFIKVYTL